jgi:hypothetical protein
MRLTNKTKKRVIYPLLFIILSAIVIFNIVRISSGAEQNKVVTFKVEGGWGYRIYRGERTAIEQPFIPLLPGKTPFPTRQSAKRTGKLVLDRLEKGSVPVLTFKDLEEIGIVP